MPDLTPEEIIGRLFVIRSRVIEFVATNIPSIEEACKVIVALAASAEVRELLKADIDRDIDRDGPYYIVTATYVPNKEKPHA